MTHDAERISATKLARELSDVLSRVRYRGQRFLVERGGELIAAIGPASAPFGPTVREFAQLLTAAPRPDAEFADDLERIHSGQPGAVDQFRAWPS
jgi:antitoxin (DNA-binding transcriptional repressor) of toxin-antitoxin stability system